MVKDGSGHGWPLYAQITVDGVPGGPVFTDPATGRYEPAAARPDDYTLHVTAEYPGYQPSTDDGRGRRHRCSKDVACRSTRPPVAPPGYRLQSPAPGAFSSTSAPPGGASTTNTTGGGWVFEDLGNRGNLTGGSDGFAIIDSDHWACGSTRTPSCVHRCWT